MNDDQRSSVPAGKLTQISQQNTVENEESDSGSSEKQPESQEEGQIDIIQTPNGLIVTSDDPKLLAEFEQMAMLLNEQMANGPVEPSIFYLKYVPAASAAELVKQVMTGQVSAGGGGGLLGDVASNVLGGVGGGFLGGILGASGGGTTSSSGPPLASGEVSIIPDPRLNYLIVHANPTDMETIDQLLKIIDQEDSPLPVETMGRPQIIPVVYADAAEVAALIKEAFASRIAQAQNNAGGGGNNRQPSPQEFIEALRGGGRGGRGGAAGGQAAQMPEQKMTITTDARNNSIVVTGPNSLYQEVKAFVEMIDQGSMDTQEDVQVVQLGGNMNATVLQSALQSVLGAQAKTNVAGQTPAQGAGPTQPGGGAPTPQQLQQRADFFRQFQGGQGNAGGRNFGGFQGGFGGGGFGAGGFGAGGTGNRNFGGTGGNRGNTGGNRGGTGNTNRGNR